MTPLELLRLLRTRSALNRRVAWSTRELDAHQSRAFAELRAHAYARSSFYREFHRGLESAPLDELPVLTKSMLMDRFDEISTDRGVRLTDVERHVESAEATDRYLGRYRVAATGGTTGRRGIFLADASEWNMILASYSRAYAWAGLPVGLTHPLRMAIVSSTVPTHQSSIVGATVRNPLTPTLRLDATARLSETVASLNDFRPDALVGYASILRELAAEQAAGRLSITPRAVFSASEVLTAEIRDAAAGAWGSVPYNVYAATETAGIASECGQHHLHVYSDLVILESVDDGDQPVSDGEAGAKLLVTVLFSRTQPLIRYELTDRVRLARAQLTDLGPFTVSVAEIEGRTEDVLSLPGRGAEPVRIHPNVFHAVMESANAPWQVIRGHDGLRVLVAGRVDADRLRMALTDSLAAVGVATVPIVVESVAAIPRTALGKAPLIRDTTQARAGEQAVEPASAA